MLSYSFICTVRSMWSVSQIRADTLQYLLRGSWVNLFPAAPIPLPVQWDWVCVCLPDCSHYLQGNYTHWGTSVGSEGLTVELAPALLTRRGMRVRGLEHVTVIGLPLSSPDLTGSPFTWSSALSTCSQSGIVIPTGPHWPAGNLCHLRASVSSYVTDWPPL